MCVCACVCQPTVWLAVGLAQSSQNAMFSNGLCSDAVITATGSACPANATCLPGSDCTACADDLWSAAHPRARLALCVSRDTVQQDLLSDQHPCAYMTLYTCVWVRAQDVQPAAVDRTGLVSSSDGTRRRAKLERVLDRQQQQPIHRHHEPTGASAA
jgi:hypothetical protein